MGRERRVKLLIAYNGARYHGWQVQPRGATVQGALESCLSRITNAPVRLHGAGRTDAGVHALGQVAHFDTASSIPAASLVRGLNGLLPDDIAVRRAVDVAADFHARYDATGKTYVYQIHSHAVRSALHAPYAWHVPQGLDVAAMREAARPLPGRHDFSAFRGASRSDTRQPVRFLYRLSLRQRRPVSSLCSAPTASCTTWRAASPAPWSPSDAAACRLKRSRRCCAPAAGPRRHLRRLPAGSFWRTCPTGRSGRSRQWNPRAASTADRDFLGPRSPPWTIQSSPQPACLTASVRKRPQYPFSTIRSIGGQIAGR